MNTESYVGICIPVSRVLIVHTDTACSDTAAPSLSQAVTCISVPAASSQLLMLHGESVFKQRGSTAWQGSVCGHAFSSCVGIVRTVCVIAPG